MKITSPKADEQFKITSEPAWPSIDFETDGAGPHTWHWTISWKSFSKSGKAETTGNEWDAKDAVTNLGGKLTVKATAGKNEATISVHVIGENPSRQQGVNYLNTKSDTHGFDKLLEHESHFTQFGKKGEPIVSFDNGYGMSQLTHPTPTYEQAWNWKLNVDAGLKLFTDDKVKAAKTYLSQHGRSYTEEQLQYEAVCRYNGGSYHRWDSKNKTWVRNPNILCDSQTSNNGWDMTDPSNVGKTADELHKRDKSSYQGGAPGDNHWRHYGVCYADRILGEPLAVDVTLLPAPAGNLVPIPYPNMGWNTPGGELVHPDAPAGSGGLGIFANSHPYCPNSSLGDEIPHPRSPVVRMLDPVLLCKRTSP